MPSTMPSTVHRSGFGSSCDQPPKPAEPSTYASLIYWLRYFLSGAAFADMYATFYISLVIMRFSSSDRRTWPHHRRGFPAHWMILSWIMLSAYVCSILLGRSFNTWDASPIPFCYDPFRPAPPTAPPEPRIVPDKPAISWESEWDTDEFFASQYHRHVHRLGFGAEFEELCSHEGARSILIDSLLDGLHVIDNSVPDISPTGRHCAATSLRLGVDEITDTIRLTSSCSASAHFS
jgi:hypothetical protein